MGSRAALAAATTVAVCLLAACSSDVMATRACRDPLHRVLVAPSSPASGAPAGEATPSPSIDPAEQRPLGATAVFHPDAHPEQALPVTVLLDDGTGADVTRVERCQVLTVMVVLAAEDVPASHGTVRAGHVALRSESGAGSLRLVDQPTYIREADNGSGAQDYAGFTGWYALMEDPAAGVYRMRRRVTWEPIITSVGTTAQAPQTPELPAAGVLELALTIT